jgi:hypothetical protein
VAGEHCASNCSSKDHASFGECVRSKNIRAQWLGGTGPSQSGQKAWDRENMRYEKAVQDGLQPAGVGHQAIDAAYRAVEG